MTPFEQKLRKFVEDFRKEHGITPSQRLHLTLAVHVLENGDLQLKRHKMRTLDEIEALLHGPEKEMVVSTFRQLEASLKPNQVLTFVAVLNGTFHTVRSTVVPTN